MSFVALSVMFQFRFLQYWLPRRYLLVQSQQQTPEQCLKVVQS